MSLRKVPVESLPGVGEKKKEDLELLGIRSVDDLLQYYPFRYEDTYLTDIVQAEDNTKVTIMGRIVNTPSIKWFSKKKSRMLAQLETSGIRVNVVWFNQAYLRDKIQHGKSIAISGKWDRSRLQVIADRTYVSEKEQKEHIGRLQAVYSITGSITIKWLRKLIYEAFLKYGQEIKEILPLECISRYKLLSRSKAMYLVHFPKRNEEQDQARRRMVYEELFLYELKILWLKKLYYLENKGITHVYDKSKIKDFIEQLPFLLTLAQERVIKEILSDLENAHQMNRLLQGDVGSGKTIVASIALYANFLSGYQGALMVPTEILAEQHFLSLQEILTPYGVSIVILTGSMTAKERRSVLSQVESGAADLIVGTHALIQDSVIYNKLGFTIIDEQHRFGVKQRSLLREKGGSPDVLFMTATPIPRTLAITVFGEMEVSTIDEMPKGREPVETHWVKKDLWVKVMYYIEKECKKGKQAYIVCPLIEESEKLDLQNTQDIFEELREKLSSIKIGLLHGRMHPTEKDEVMSRFKNNDIDVLVSTTVIEVGVNVPNATLMIIYDADRFGLAQLHQLRGRVGRGGGSSMCILVANPKSEVGVERMRIMTETTDGFEISRRDLELRGPGDFLGVKQSGLPDFKIANLTEDYRVLEVARKDVINILPKLNTQEEYTSLRNYLEQEQVKEIKFD